MKTTSLFIHTFLFLLFFYPAYGQLNIPIKEKIKNKVEDRINRGVDEAIDRGLDKTEEEIREGVKGDPKKNNSTDPASPGASQKQDDNPSESSGNDASPGVKSDNPPLQAYSKFDFVAGEKIIAFEDFSADAVGDFPARWNTNGSAEVVTLSKYPGKWLKVDNVSGVSLVPDDFNQLPENFTLEFDLIYNNWNREYAYARRVMASFFQADKASERMGEPAAGPGFGFTFDGNMGEGSVSITNFNTDGYNGEINNEKSMSNVINPDNNGKLFHISIWRQKTRVRVYVDEQKVFDLPRILDAATVLNAFRLYVDISDENKPLLFSNFKLAVGAPDTRNKLVSEGKFSTTGILFDVNSDKIKAESYGVLKEIATVLQENPDLKVKITGHTDSDGDAAKNLDLSKRRAHSVKEALVSVFGINGGRLTTDGKGAAEPVAPNTTPEGKAQNRRVEFTRM